MKLVLWMNLILNFSDKLKTPSRPMSFPDIQHVFDKNKRKTVSPAESDKFKKPKALLMK